MRFLGETRGSSLNTNKTKKVKKKITKKMHEKALPPDQSDKK